MEWSVSNILQAVVSLALIPAYMEWMRIREARKQAKDEIEARIEEKKTIDETELSRTLIDRLAESDAAQKNSLLEQAHQMRAEISDLQKRVEVLTQQIFQTERDRMKIEAKAALLLQENLMLRVILKDNNVAIPATPFFREEEAGSVIVPPLPSSLPPDSQEGQEP